MRTFLSWSDKVHDKDGIKQPIYDIAFNPEGSQLIVAAGAEILVYDISEGDLLQPLKAHKDTVFCLDYSADGKRFASGGADKQVIIWSDKLEGILKYSHNDSIQVVTHNPVTGAVLSCAISDFGVWSAEQKTVSKHKITSRICSASWTGDGLFFALGLFNGTVSIRNKAGEEVACIDRGTQPVWCLQWNPGMPDVLVVLDWDQRLGFFNRNGKQLGKDRVLGFDPCGVGFFLSGEYLVVGGSDHKVSLWTAEGVRMGVVCERDSW
ncbi:hypothetical protein HK096_007006, partial [Nowakowskiella sp. JEL0078]